MPLVVGSLPTVSLLVLIVVGAVGMVKFSEKRNGRVYHFVHHHHASAKTKSQSARRSVAAAQVMKNVLGAEQTVSQRRHSRKKAGKLKELHACEWTGLKHTPSKSDDGVISS